jgi:hypothetical protein
MDKTVFVSYAAHDRAAVSRVIDALRATLAPTGVKIWNDEQIETGEEWERALEDAIASADGFVVVVSPNYLASNFAMYELGMMLSRAGHDKVPIIPVILEKADVPFLKRYQSIDAQKHNPSEVATQIKETLERAEASRSAASA